MALFSTTRQQQSSHLVEFRAGKMYSRGGGESGAAITVHPDKRKGMVYIHQSDDALMHFCWKDRTSGAVEDDLIVFPDDVEFVPVKQCTTGRVFLLKFKNSSRKLFFWMQEPKSDKDDEYCRKVNELLNNPPAPGAGRSGRGGGGQDGFDQFAMMNQLLGLGGSGGGGGEERMDLQNALAGMDHQQLMQLLNLMGTGTGGGSGGFGGFAESSSVAPSVSRVSPPTTTTAAATTQPSVTPAQAVTSTTTAGASATTTAAGATTGRPTTSQTAVQLTDLRNILANLSGGVAAEGGGETAVDLETVLTASNIEQAVMKAQNEGRLLPHLPDEQPVQRTRQELVHTVRSPQFRQAVEMFSMALQTGQLAPLMTQFGLPESAVEACARGDVQSVAEILEREAASAAAGSSAGGGGAEKDDKDKKEKEKSSEPPPKKDKPDDEGMELD